MCFVDQQHGNVVLDRVNTVAGAAFKLVFFLVIGQRRFAGGTGQDFQQIAVNHNERILPPLVLSGVEIEELGIAIPK